LKFRFSKQPADAGYREVLAQLDLSQTTSKLLAVIANTQGATLASKHAEIQYLGFPFSISENFQMRNTQNNCRVVANFARNFRNS
jgi:hypothetical protein